MNLFRIKNSEELETKLEACETLIKDLEISYASLVESNKELTEKVSTLMEQLKAKEEIIETKEEVIESLEEVVEAKVEEIEAKEELIQEVIENTVTVEKQAAIKALEILADSGVDVIETIEAPEEIDLMAQMKKLSGSELVRFYQDHKSEIQKLSKI